jgi:PadR family transcriptional regulator PadR
MLKGVLALLLLSLLAEREDYGYSVVVRLRAAGFEGLNEGTVYPALTRLEASGLLEASLVRSTSGPARKYYRVTEQGAAHRERSLTDWQALVAGVEQITATTTLGRTS